MRKEVALYRKLLVLYPSGFRSGYEEPMTQMVIDQINSEGSNPLLWIHLIADLFRSAIKEHVRTLLGSMRAKPAPLWGLLLVAGGVFGFVVAAIGALGGGFATGSGSSIGSSMWLLVSYVLVLFAFTASVLVVEVKGSPLVGFGTLLMAVGQLSVIAHEVQVLNPGFILPSMGAASAFPVMLGAGLVAAGMSESTAWSKSHMWPLLVIALYPLVLVFGAYPIAVQATGSEVSADLVFKAGYMIAWAAVGAAFLLANPPNPHAQKEAKT